ncbi:MAG: tRNA (adenosine(37)-N6)-dimethylallyltransferase MiaA [Bacteriovoracaceae bacterium]|nr:tRNA (adenosine(37)-N6)-dimethylallyltransferase MiaA [Bacteriovoracaceae bacterium]
MTQSKVVIISGPTATGKTDIAIHCALKAHGLIINFDSLLFYKELCIGTARPSKEEQKGVPHYLLASESAHHPINAADFVKKALPLMQELQKLQQPLFLVGGSGFYLKALMQGMYPSVTPSPDILKKSEDLFKEEGITAFLNILEKCDPENFKILHPNDHYRIRRAVEHFWSTGIPFSQAKKIHTEKEHSFPYDFLHIYLDYPKPIHEERIQKRTENMLNQGLIQEVQSLLSHGFQGDEKPLLSIGYKETQAYLQGSILSLKELKEKIIIATRQLAKSQRTWFQKIPNKVVFCPPDQDKIWGSVQSFLIK